ncbi:MAG: glycosyltransferase [Cyanothece sp. SIO2G6]|nr:glycosyltransferase [Cyanothece sp. SIO2G6]
MIVKNEAERLAQCLESAQPFVDEIVVVDTGSTDDTVAIAQQFTATIHHHAWNNDFAAARNYALQYVTGDWVLVLDADEQLTAKAGSQIRPLLEQNPHTLVINLVRQEIGAAQSPYSLVSRLFRVHPDIRFTRPYHAMVDDSVAEIIRREPQWTVAELPGVAILHDGYGAEAIANRNKLQNARLTMERYLAEHPNDPYVCSKLGALYVQMDRTTYGIDLLKKGLKVANSEAAIAYELHYHLGIAYTQANCMAQALHHYQAAIEQPILPSLKLGAYNNLGSLRQRTKDLKAAQQLFITVVEIDPNFAKGHFNLGMVLKQMGQFAEAIAHYQQAIQLQADYAEAYQNLGVVLLKLGRVDRSMAAFREAIALHTQQNPSEAERLRQGLTDMGF